MTHLLLCPQVEQALGIVHYGMTDVLLPPRDRFLREEVIRGGMDLLFFANTRHLRRADEMLAAHGLGRAHHRVLYFVARRPGITVSELLGVLGIAKQSLGRVANELLARNLIYQERGRADARQRLYRLTPEGAELEQAIFTELHDNVARAYAAAGGEAVTGFWVVLQHLIGEEGRAQFRAVQEGHPGKVALPAGAAISGRAQVSRARPVDLKPT